MNKDGLFQELDNLIEDGKKELSKYSYIDDPYEFQYVDKFFFEPWYYKVLTILSLFPELANNPFSNSISHLNDAFYSDVEMIIKDLEAIKELVEKDIINLENDNSPTDYHENNDPIVFISHSSSDKKYGDAIRNLLIGLGIKDSSLIYTSHPRNKIPLDSNIFEYLKQKLEQKVFMIILWSNTYLQSPACLNEMGAAWVTQSDYTNFYTPDFEFGNPKYHECAVDTRKMGAVLNGDENCKASILQFKNTIKDLFEIQTDEEKESWLIDQFINDISS